MTTAEHLPWRTSSRSSNGEACVEVAPAPDGVVVRHSKDRGAGSIHFSFPAWATFVRGALGDSTNQNGSATITAVGVDTLVRCTRTDVQLRFDPDEWSAFRAGAAVGEFDVTALLVTS